MANGTIERALVRGVFEVHVICLKPHSNGRNNGQQFPTSLDAVRLHTLLLGVVVQSLKPVKPLSQQPPTFLLFCDR